MTDLNTSINQKVKMKQYRNTMVVGGIAIAVILGIIYMTGDNGTNEISKKGDDTSNFVSPLDQVNVQSVWTERLQNKVKEEENKTEELKKEINDLKNADTQKSVDDDPKYQALVKQNQLLQDSLNNKSEPASTMQGGNAYNGKVFSTAVGGQTNGGEQALVVPAEAAGIDNDELSLSSTDTKPIKNADTFVSAGTFAEAIMLGAADASAGVQAQSNPSPMLFRIVANGTLPNKQTSHLKDCVVTAAVVGDISSERGQIRLERMSCTFPNGEIVEQPVEGTVFGMDAKNGVRGNPVWREGALLGRAAVAGALSGLGSAVSQTYTTNSISPLGSTETVNNGEIFKYGAAQGVSSAMDKLADYNIRRAEQYHPVIQLTAGQPVDVVFLKGFYLDGRTHDENTDASKAPTDLFPASSNTAQTSGLTLSETELAKIKQHEQSMGLGN